MKPSEVNGHSGGNPNPVTRIGMTEVRERLGCHEKTVRRYVRTGNLTMYGTDLAPSFDVEEVASLAAMLNEGKTRNDRVKAEQELVALEAMDVPPIMATLQRALQEQQSHTREMFKLIMPAVEKLQAASLSIIDFQKGELARLSSSQAEMVQAREQLTIARAQDELEKELVLGREKHRAALVTALANTAPAVLKRLMNGSGPALVTKPGATPAPTDPGLAAAMVEDIEAQESPRDKRDRLLQELVTSLDDKLLEHLSEEQQAKVTEIASTFLSG